MTDSLIRTPGDGKAIIPHKGRVAGCCWVRLLTPHTGLRKSPWSKVRHQTTLFTPSHRGGPGAQTLNSISGCVLLREGWWPWFREVEAEQQSLTTEATHGLPPPRQTPWLAAASIQAQPLALAQMLRFFQWVREGQKRLGRRRKKCQDA